MFSQTKFRDQRLTRTYQLFSEMTTGSIWRTFSNHLFESNGREAKKHLKLYSFQFTKVFFFFRLPWSQRHILITCLEWLGAKIAFLKKIVHQYCHNIAMKFCCSIHATLKNNLWTSRCMETDIDSRTRKGWIPIMNEAFLSCFYLKADGAL